MKLLPLLFSDRLLSFGHTDLYTLALALILTGSLLAAYSLIVLNSKRRGFHDDKDLSERAYQDALRILDSARADSLKILGRAQSKAQTLLNNTYIISKENRERLDYNLQNIYANQEKSLSSLTKDLLDSYKVAVKDSREENIRTLYEATESMKNEALKGVSEIKEVISKETLQAKGQLEDKIKAEYLDVEKEIESYKVEKLKNLNNRIFDILADVYAEVIRQDLDQIKHEKLIISLLKEEIRRSGIRNISQADTFR